MTRCAAPPSTASSSSPSPRSWPGSWVWWWPTDVDYYQSDLALVHALGYGQHADNCAPGVLGLLAPVLGGLVLEVGCGAGALTRHLLAAGHRVIATDASAAMVSLARSALGSSADVRRL